MEDIHGVDVSWLHRSHKGESVHAASRVATESSIVFGRRLAASS